MPTAMPTVMVPEGAELAAESARWDREARKLHRHYLLAVVATVLAVFCALCVSTLS